MASLITRRRFLGTGAFAGIAGGLRHCLRGDTEAGFAIAIAETAAIAVSPCIAPIPGHRQ